MNFITKYNLIKKLNQSLKNNSIGQNDLIDNIDKNEFYQILSQLSDKDILNLAKDSKLKYTFDLMIGEYEKLNDKLKTVAERIEYLLVSNNLKDSKYCFVMKTFDIWKPLFDKRTETLLRYRGDLPGEYKIKLKQLIKDNPNLIYDYVGKDNEIISLAFAQENIDIKKSSKNNIDPNYGFVNNQDFLIRYIKQFGKSDNYYEHNNVYDQLKLIHKNKDYFYPVWDYVISNNYIDDKLIEYVVNLKDYKRLLGWCDLQIIQSTLFQKLYSIYGPIELSTSYDLTMEEEMKIIKELFKKYPRLIEYSSFKKVNSTIIKKIYNNESLLSIINLYKSDIESIIEIYKEIGKPITKEDIYKCPEIYNYIDTSVDFTLQEYMKYSILGTNKKIIKQLLNKNELDCLKYTYYPIDEELALLAIEKGYEFKIEELRRPGYSENDVIISYLLNKGEFSVIYKYRGNNPDVFKKAIVLNPEYINELFNNKRWNILNSLTSDSEVSKYFDEKHLAIVKYYGKIKDGELKDEFQTFVLENINDLEISKISMLFLVLDRISKTNSAELLKCKKSLAKQLLVSDNPLLKLDTIEQIFIKNNLPEFAKSFSVFLYLHPEFRGYNFDSNSKISPVLKTKSNNAKTVIIFSDLLKCAMGSNNRSLKAYLDNIESGSKIFEDINNNRRSLEELNDEELEILRTFSKHLNTLFNNTKYIKSERVNKEDLIENIRDLQEKLKINGNESLDLKDTLIRKFCSFAGINSFEEAIQYFKTQTVLANEKGLKNAYNFSLEVGDFIKGIDKIEYLSNILNNGSVAADYLGTYSNTDATPLDTDLARICEIKEDYRKTISKTSAKTYGNFFLVLKNDGRFNVTRTDEKENLESKADLTKLEVFYTGVTGNDHYGIRTGFPSSAIDYIISEKSDKRIGLEVALNGFYIPVFDMDGNLIFSPNDYNLLREKMSGLSRYDLNEYNFAKKEDLLTPEIEEIAESLEFFQDELVKKREAVNEAIKKALNSINLELKTYMDGDLTEGYVEFIDTGSTGRNTNLPGDGDFDFIMRLDKTIINDPEKLNVLKQALKQSFKSIKDPSETQAGDFRFKEVSIEGLDKPVDIDITFMQKNNEIVYSTDMALKDRLLSIKKQDQEKYKFILANIIEAKKIFKENECYKPNRGLKKEGGLGGIGIENWILQNGGSLKKAAEEFLKYSENKTFIEFKKEYQIWDFGQNHLSQDYRHYSHDNFVESNMSEEGYNKMVIALREYLKKLEINDKEISSDNLLK